MSTHYWLRDKERISYIKPDLTDDYRELGMFSIDINNCKIEHHSIYGLMIGNAISYPYFVQNMLWCKFYTVNYKNYYFEKTIQEIKSIKGIESYFDWIRSKYHLLLPYYRNRLLLHINIKYKYQPGDIVQLQDASIHQKRFYKIKKAKYLSISNEKHYKLIQLDENSSTLTSGKQIENQWSKENELKLIISAMDCFNKFNNNTITIQQHLLLVKCQVTNSKLSEKTNLLLQQNQVLVQICYELCERMLTGIELKQLIWMKRCFVHQYKTVSMASTMNMHKEMMIIYLEKEYGLPQTCWTERNNGIGTSILSLDRVEKILSEEAVVRVVGDWLIFIAEPRFILQDEQMMFKSHICEMNIYSNLMNGSPNDKRERLRLKRIFWKEQRKFYGKLINAYNRIHMNAFELQIMPRCLNYVILKYYARLVQNMGVYTKYCKDRKNT